MTYQFDTTVATKYGVDAAVFLQNLAFWIKKNQANKKNFYDGHYWTYNSIAAYAELFPFWTTAQLRRIIEKLEKSGTVLSGNYNKVQYDRTKWYTIADESICKLYEIDLCKPTNEVAEISEPIPDRKPDRNPDPDKERLPEPPPEDNSRDARNIPALPTNRRMSTHTQGPQKIGDILARFRAMAEAGT